MRCSAFSLRPTVSAAGLSLSWGRVSQDGNSITSISELSSLQALAISSACREDGVTTTIGTFDSANHWLITKGCEVTGAKNSPAESCFGCD